MLSDYETDSPSSNESAICKGSALLLSALGFSIGSLVVMIQLTTLGDDETTLPRRTLTEYVPAAMRSGD